MNGWTLCINMTVTLLDWKTTENHQSGINEFSWKPKTRQRREIRQQQQRKTCNDFVQSRWNRFYVISKAAAVCNAKKTSLTRATELEHFLKENDIVIVKMLSWGKDREETFILSRRGADEGPCNHSDSCVSRGAEGICCMWEFEAVSLNRYLKDKGSRLPSWGTLGRGPQNAK